MLRILLIGPGPTAPDVLIANELILIPSRTKQLKPKKLHQLKHLRKDAQYKKQFI